MLNIHLKVAIEKNWTSQNFDFIQFSFSGAPTHAYIIEF